MTLQDDLDELERTDPDVQAAAQSYSRMVDRLTPGSWCPASLASTSSMPRRRCRLAVWHSGAHAWVPPAP